jgi:hypothetical protein
MIEITYKDYLDKDYIYLPNELYLVINVSGWICFNTDNECNKEYIPISDYF